MAANVFLAAPRPADEQMNSDAAEARRGRDVFARSPPSARNVRASSALQREGSWATQSWIALASAVGLLHIYQEATVLSSRSPFADVDI